MPLPPTSLKALLTEYFSHHTDKHCELGDILGYRLHTYGREINSISVPQENDTFTYEYLTMIIYMTGYMTLSTAVETYRPS